MLQFNALKEGIGEYSPFFLGKSQAVSSWENNCFKKNRIFRMISFSSMGQSFKAAYDEFWLEGSYTRSRIFTIITLTRITVLVYIFPPPIDTIDTMGWNKLIQIIWMKKIRMKTTKNLKLKRHSLKVGSSWYISSNSARNLPSPFVFSTFSRC